MRAATPTRPDAEQQTELKASVSEQRALSSVSFSSAAGSESNSRVAPARTVATPRSMCAVRRVRPVFMPPSKPIIPTAPPYQRRGACSWSSMNCMAQALGAPVTVTAHMWVRNASSAASEPSRAAAKQLPPMWSTVCAHEP